MGIMVYSLSWVMQDLYHEPSVRKALSGELNREPRSTQSRSTKPETLAKVTAIIGAGTRLVRRAGDAE